MEDWVIYFGLASVISVILAIVSYFHNKGDRNVAAPEVANRNVRQVQRPGAAQANRRAGVRNRRTVRRGDDSDSDEGQAGAAAPDPVDREILDEEGLLNDPKLGAKKKAKLEAKLEKKAQREADEKLRKEKKEQEAKEEEERKKREEIEEMEEKQKLEEEKRRREEEEREDLERYMKMKAAFVVESEGCEAVEEEEEQNLLEEFITHIKKKKVILFEELASQFGLRVPDTIERITTLVQDGRLTGVMDDRGKFIYISEGELKNFATFIKQRGRVSITELVENSSSLITITAET